MVNSRLSLSCRACLVLPCLVLCLSSFNQVRRAAFELCSLEGPQADNWVQLAKRARAAGQFAVAGAALRRAARLGVCQDRLAFEDAKLAKEREGVSVRGVSDLTDERRSLADWLTGSSVGKKKSGFDLIWFGVRTQNHAWSWYLGEIRPKSKGYALALLLFFLFSRPLIWV